MTNTIAYFKDKHIHKVYASPLKRARETAGIIAKEFDLPVTVLEQFREINVGLLERLPPTENASRCGADSRSKRRPLYKGRARGNATVATRALHGAIHPDHMILTFFMLKRLP